MSGTRESEKRVALVIGNGKYQKTSWLSNPPNDAEKMSAVLDRLGFEVLDGTNLDYATFSGRVRDFSRALRDAHVALFFYAGHGLQVRGENYVVPIDAALEHEADVQHELITVQTILASMEIGNRTSIVILDACRDNPLARNLARAIRSTCPASDEIGRGLGRLESGIGTYIAFATSPNKVALDGAGAANSPFTTALLKHIETPGVAINDIMMRVRNDVIEATDTMRGGPQVPWDNSSLVAPFYFNPSMITQEQKALEGEAAQAGPLPFNERVQVSQWWERIKDCDDPAMLEQFLERYPESELAPLARDKLCELEWQRLRSSRNAEEIAGFLKRWPDSRFKAAARKRLKALQRKVSGAGVALLWKKINATVVIAGVGAAAIYFSFGGDTPPVQPVEIHPFNDVNDDGKVLVTYSTADRSNEKKWMEPGSGKSFQDCWKANNKQVCGPEMVVVPAGSFNMGSPDNEEGRESRESPQHEVTIAKPFAVGKFEVTFADWDRCVSDGGCQYKPKDKGWGRRDRPVINVSWNDITNEYLPWLCEVTGKDYRLLSEAEWEYAARAGTTAPFWWGGSISTEQANFDGNYTYGGGNEGEYREKTLPVKSFDPNPWGLYQVHGNVREWTQDCWHGNYDGAPANGDSWTSGICNRRILRGGSWKNLPIDLRSAVRIYLHPDKRSPTYGFRLFRTIKP